MGVTTYHIVKHFEDTKYGSDVWKSMCDWYDGDVMNNDTTECLISKLDNYRLTLSSNSSNYIKYS